MIVKENYSLKQLNTFGIDVKTMQMLIIENEDDISESLDKINSFNNKLVLGGGSNILFTKDFDGIIIKSEISGIEKLKIENEKIYLEIGSGVIWDDLVQYCVENNYGGIENLSLIPGTVGAAPIQNIGAYGAELKDVCHSLKGINIETGEQLTFNNEQCRLGYRDSIFKRELKNKIFIVKVILKLDLIPKIITSHLAVYDSLTEEEKASNDIRKVREVVCTIRKSKLPDPTEIGNAGSFFKNPIVNKELLFDLENKYNSVLSYKVDNNYKIPAGWLIEKAGLKGKRFGNVGVHKKQALVLVNYGNATGEEILNLAENIKDLIYDKFNINLETEVNIV